MLQCKRCTCSQQDLDQTVRQSDPYFLEPVFAALASGHRLRLLLLLAIQPHCVCDLATHSGLSQSLVSQYMTILENVALVQKERVGKFTEFSLTPKGKSVVKAIHVINSFEK